MLHRNPVRIAMPLLLLAAACASEESDNSWPGVSGKGGTGGTSLNDSSAERDTSSTDSPIADSKADLSQGEAGAGGTGEDGGQESDPLQDAPQETQLEATTCQPVQAAPAVDPWQIRIPSAGFGGLETSATGGHTDVFLKSPAPSPDYVRVGARLDWGGSVVFFGLSSNAKSNTIDANDTGRELQIALYDPTRAMQGCAWNASCQTSPSTCPNSISYLGWDPVQGGDRCGHGSSSTHSQAGDALRILANPLQWNPDWDKHDCSQTPCGATGVPVGVTYQIDFRFVAIHVVEVAVEILSQETIEHPSTGQEFPTLYVANGNNGPDLPVLLDASGKTVALNTPGNDGFFYDNFTSPGPWVTWQNSTQDYGVALAMDQGILAWQGWRGDGQTAPYFHNVRPILAFGLKPSKPVRGISYLVLGSFATVQSQIADTLKARPPFGILESPAAGGSATISAGQNLALAGWVLDTTPIDQVQVEVDGVLATSVPVTVAREDVCESYPAYAGCPKVGFSGELVPTGWDLCPHLVRVLAKDAEGNTTVLGESVVTRAQ